MFLLDVSFFLFFVLFGFVWLFLVLGCGYAFSWFVPVGVCFSGIFWFRLVSFPCVLRQCSTVCRPFCLSFFGCPRFSGF
uniref:Uncharacterized protein n=1 Tax=Anopheles darlingi TaxID=43151 RepID=A0A2M4CK44_ANODA